MLDGINFKQIVEEDKAMLISKFEENEIQEAIWECDGNI